jgi:hypothetical protein
MSAIAVSPSISGACREYGFGSGFFNVVKQDLEKVEMD